MKEITMFMKAGCPYCREAFDYIDELKKEDARYASLKIKEIDEEKEAELANTFDYYYVPTFYVDGEKLHEGLPSKEAVKEVLDAALE